MFAALSSLGLQDLILKVRKVQFRFVFRFLTTTKELLEIWIYFLLIKSVDEFFFLRREHFNVWVSELFPVLIRRYNFCAYRFLLKVKPRTVCRRNEWVSVTIEFRSWPNFDAMFPGATHCFGVLQKTINISQWFSEGGWKYKTLLCRNILWVWSAHHETKRKRFFLEKRKYLHLNQRIKPVRSEDVIFVATLLPIGGEATYVVEMSEWVQQ